MKENSNIKKIYNSVFLSYLVLNITNCLCNIASGYIAGNFLDSIAVSCNSLLRSYISIISGIGTMIAIGSEIMCGRYMGVGDRKSINKMFSVSIVLAVAGSLLITLISFVFSGPIIHLLGAEGELLIPGNTYLKSFSFGVITYILMPVLIVFLHLNNDGKSVTVSVVILTVTYILFGYLFIKVLDLSYFGFGLTNSVSRLFALMYLIYRTYRNRKQVYFDFTDINKTHIIEPVALGVPSGIAAMLPGIRNIILNKVLYATAGVTGIAAYSVLGSSVTVDNALYSSVVQSATIIASICYGEKNKEDIKELFRYVFTRILFVLSLFMAVQMIFSRSIAGIFSMDDDCIILASMSIRLYLPSIVLSIIVDTLISLLTIYEYKKFANIFNILNCFIIHTLFAIAAQKYLGYYSVVAGFIATQVVCLIILAAYIMSKNKSFSLSYDSMVLGNIKYRNVIKYALTVNSLSEIENISVGVIDFCLNNGVDHRKANLAGLCAEEAVSNVFEHGFTKKAVRDPKVDVFALIENETVTIRIRDNAVAFDPTSREIVFNPEDPCKNIGIRTIRSIAKEVTYQNLFGLNSLIIRI